MAATFWDLLSVNRELASLLLREGFDPSSLGPEHPLPKGVDIVAAAEAYILKAQADGQIRQMDPRFFMFLVASTAISYHGAPGMRESMLTLEHEEGAKATRARMDGLGGVSGS